MKKEEFHVSQVPAPACQGPEGLSNGSKHPSLMNRKRLSALRSFNLTDKCPHTFEDWVFLFFYPQWTFQGSPDASPGTQTPESSTTPLSVVQPPLHLCFCPHHRLWRGQALPLSPRCPSTQLPAGCAVSATPLPCVPQSCLQMLTFPRDRPALPSQPWVQAQGLTHQLRHVFQ